MFFSGNYQGRIVVVLLRQAEKDIKAGKNLSPVFADAKSANDYLDSLK